MPDHDPEPTDVLELGVLEPGREVGRTRGQEALMAATGSAGDGGGPAKHGCTAAGGTPAMPDGGEEGGRGGKPDLNPAESGGNDDELEGTPEGSERPEEVGSNGDPADKDCPHDRGWGTAAVWCGAVRGTRLI